MQLSVIQRLILLRLLPEKGNLTTLKIVRGIQNRLSFTEEEHAQLNFKTIEGDRVQWNSDAPVVAEVKIGLVGKKLIYDKLQELDEQGDLDMALLELCEMFEYKGSADADD